MQKGFWNKLARPIVGLSPMDGVTDAPWRFIAKKYGKADVIFTEFVSAEGLMRINRRKEFDHRIWNELKFDESERPVVAQLFGSEPEAFYESAKIVCDLGFDGVDINMGCPSPGLEKRGGGAGLIRVPDLAKKVIEETRRGVEDWVSEGENRNPIPVSVKTRVGSSEPDREWWKFLASMKLPAVSMHGRTFKQLYSGEADWDLLQEAAGVIKSEDTLFLANGDVKNISVEGLGNKEDLNRFPVKLGLTSGKVIDGTVFDGLLIGRAAMGNPWALLKDGYVASTEERLRVAIEHAKKYEEIFSGEKFFAMRKHLAWYAHGSPNVSELRRKLVMSNSSIEVEEAVKEFLEKPID